MINYCLKNILSVPFFSAFTPGDVRHYTYVTHERLTMIIIYKARDIIEAHIVSGLLKSNGIESHVSGHYLQGGVGDLAASDFANVHIDNDDISAATIIIAEYEGMQNSSIRNINIKETTLTSRLFLAILAFTFCIFIFYLVTL